MLIFSWGFLAHLIDFYQMCYCCRKLDFQRNLSKSASHGLSRPRTLSLSQSNDWKQVQRVHGRPWEAVRGRERPNLASHRLGLTEFVMWSVWANQRARSASHAHRGSDCIARCAWEADRPHRFESPICEADRPLTHTGRCNAFSREISQTAPRMTASPGVRERPIGLSNLWGRVRHVICLRVRSRVGGRSASHAHRASRTSTGWSNAFSREISQASPRIVLPRPVEVRLAQCAWEADRPPTRLRTLTASQIGLSRPHRSASQIGLSDRSDRLDWS